MGTESSTNNNSKQAEHIDDSITSQFLKQFQLYKNPSDVQVKSLSHGGKLAIFQRKQQAFMSDQENHKQLISLNFQSVCKQRANNELQSMRNHIDYYKKRIQLSLDPDTDTVSSIIKLLHFSIKNQTTNELIYPESTSWKLLSKNKSQNQQKNKKLLPSCGFDSIFNKKHQDNRQPSLLAARKQIYTFSFLQEFNMDSLQKQIRFRHQNHQCFKQKEIWSIIYCCCKAASKMITNGLKQPVLSPGSIFINQKCEIKVSEWQFVNYYIAQNSFQQQSQHEQGQTFVTNELQMTITQGRSKQNTDILTRYYWPPEGLVEMQNILRLGEIQSEAQSTNINGNINSQRQRQKVEERQKLYEAKNSQVFCLGMTLLQLLTLRPYYQKATYSQKQLTKLVEKAIDIRQQMGQQMSQEMVDLLLEMLQWDPLERFRYSDIIEYVHQVFETNQLIFGEETSRVGIQVRSARSQINGSQPTDSQTNRGPKMDIKRVAQVTVNSNKKLSSRNSKKQKSHQKFNNDNISKKIYKQESTSKLILIYEEIEVKIDRLQDSGIMWPGKGDDYNPHYSDQEQQDTYLYKPLHHLQQNKVENSYMRRNQLSSLVPDSQDAPQLAVELACSQEIEIPDQDVDYEGEQLHEKYQQNLLSQEKRYVQSFNINPLNSMQTESLPQQFSVYQYVPPHWPALTKSYDSRQSLKEKQFNSTQNRNQLNLSRDSLASFNLKFLNKSTEDINLKKNISFDPLFTDSNNKFSSPPQNLYVNNLSTIVKQTQSPQMQKSDNKQNLFAFQTQTNNSNNPNNIFTSQNILEMIREFTKKQSQQTPDFNAIQLTNQKLNLKNDIMKNAQASKKLSFDQNPSLVEKKFDKTYGSLLFESTQDKLFPFYQKQKSIQKQKQNKFNKTMNNTTPIDPIVRIQFAKGTYQGLIKNSLRNGYGTFYYKQGGKYSGYWYNNKMDGHGTLYYPDGRVAYEGQWQNDSLHGKGILYNENPFEIQGKYDFRSFDQCDNEECWISYDGWFENDEKSGFGELLLSNHEKYVGQFKNDMVDGKGKLYKLDGTIFEGIWKQNNLLYHYQ